MNELGGGLGYAVKNWWMSLLLGVLYIAVALCLLFAPVSSYVALSVIFSISILVSGIMEIFFAVSYTHLETHKAKYNRPSSIFEKLKNLDSMRKSRKFCSSK